MEPGSVARYLDWDYFPVVSATSSHCSSRVGLSSVFSLLFLFLGEIKEDIQ